MNDAVLSKREGRVMRLTLNRPDTRNALSADLVSALTNSIRLTTIQH